jgi:hypothetical protein
MAYKGERLRPLFDPALASSTTRRMADRGTDAMMEHAVEATPVNQRIFSAEVEPSLHGVPGGRRPGTLRSRWERLGPVLRDVARGQPAYTGRFHNWDPIAIFVEHDTRPHEIRPRADRAAASVVATGKPRKTGDAARLRFRLWPGGQIVYAAVVKHPGTTGQHMTLKAAGAVERDFGAVMEPELVRWAKTAVRQARRQNRRPW